MDVLRKLSGNGAMVFAVIIGVAYLVPAGFASVHRLSERAVKNVVIPDPQVALQTLLSGDDEDCLGMELQTWEFH